jgi:hypothetical protein
VGWKDARNACCYGTLQSAMPYTLQGFMRVHHSRLLKVRFQHARVDPARNPHVLACARSGAAHGQLMRSRTDWPSSWPAPG